MRGSDGRKRALIAGSGRATRLSGVREAMEYRMPGLAVSDGKCRQQ
jgi:hypothetical protein